MSVRKRLKEKLERIRETRDIEPSKMDDDILKSVLDKIGSGGIDKILSSNHGARTLKNSLHNKISEYDIGKIRKAFGAHTETLDTNALNKRFFFQYRGGWFFDLIANHKYKDNPDRNLTKFFGLFINGNSGWAKAYEVNRKDNCKSIYQEFIDDCNHLQIGPNQYVKYPVKKIISDDDSAIPNSMPGVEIEKITQRGTNHGALSRINAFASHLRSYWKDSEYITIDQMNEFIENWNNAHIPGVSCSRNEMMEDKELEEAYICGCLYHNKNVEKESEENFRAGDEVKIRELRDTFIRNPQQYRKEKTGTYKIETNDRGNIRAVNINDPNDVLNVRTREITGRVINAGRNWRDRFNDISDDEDAPIDFSYHVKRET